MAKKIRAMLKVQAPAGTATAAPPVGPALGQHGINIMEFIKAFNERTADQPGYVVPAEITVFEDRSFTFVTKAPAGRRAPQARRRRRERLGRPNKEKVGRSPSAQLREIAEMKMADLNANTVEQAMKIIAGTARRWASRWPTDGAARQEVPRGGQARRGRPPLRDRRGVPSCCRKLSITQVRRHGRGAPAAGRSTRATPTSWCAARSSCRTAPAARPGSSSSPRARRPRRPCAPAPMRWAATTWSRRSTTAGSSSTWPSPRRT